MCRRPILPQPLPDNVVRLRDYRTPVPRLVTPADVQGDTLPCQENPWRNSYPMDLPCDTEPEREEGR